MRMKKERISVEKEYFTTAISTTVSILQIFTLQYLFVASENLLTYAESIEMKKGGKKT